MLENIITFQLTPILTSESDSDIDYILNDHIKGRLVPLTRFTVGPVFENVQRQLPPPEAQELRVVILSIGYYYTYKA